MSWTESTNLFVSLRTTTALAAVPKDSKNSKVAVVAEDLMKVESED